MQTEGPDSPEKRTFREAQENNPIAISNTESAQNTFGKDLETNKPRQKFFKKDSLNSESVHEVLRMESELVRTNSNSNLLKNNQEKGPKFQGPQVDSDYWPSDKKGEMNGNNGVAIIALQSNISSGSHDSTNSQRNPLLKEGNKPRDSLFSKNSR